MAIIGSATAYAIPSYWGWTTYTPVIPKLYWDVYSQEERIKRLCMEYDKITHYSSHIAETVNELSDSVDKQLADNLAAVSAMIMEQNQLVLQQLAEMRTYIDTKFSEYTASQRVYDVTTGEYRPSDQTMRRLFQSLSYDHVGDRQLVSFYADNYSVSEMANITVYNAAYSDKTTVVIDDQIQPIN